MVGQERVKEGPEEHRGILLTEDAKVTLDEVVQGRHRDSRILIT